MKKILILIIVTCCSIIYSQSDVYLQLIVYSHLPDSSSDIFVTGNIPELGNWDPGFYKMNRLNDSTWQAEIKIHAGTDIQFKFTLGNWNREALNNDKTIPQNNIVKLFSDSTLNYYINYWADLTNTNNIGQITGEVKYHRDFGNSQLLPKRDIIVWLPPNYETDTLSRYPVLYMQDGQNIVDPATSSFGVDWQVDENADTLIRNGFIEPLIIVGIFNSSFRSSEYGINDTSKEYENFVVDELKPFIDSHYRTKTEPEFNAVAGSSLGGLIAFELAWEYPDKFSKCACVSPAFDIDRYNYVSVVQNSESNKKPIQIYIDVGEKGIDSELKTGVDEMISVLKQKGFKEGKDLFYEFYPKAEHSEKDWSKRVWKILIYLFGTEKGKSLL